MPDPNDSNMLEVPAISLETLIVRGALDAYDLVLKINRATGASAAKIERIKSRMKEIGP